MIDELILSVRQDPPSEVNRLSANYSKHHNEESKAVRVPGFEPFQNYAVADDIHEQSRPTDHQDERLPRYFYSFKEGSNELYETRVWTGEVTCYKLRDYTFKRRSVWTPLSCESILVTGGGYTATAESSIIHPTDLVVTPTQSMRTARRNHSAALLFDSVYVAGGYNSTALDKCESYNCTEAKWTAITPLPQPCSNLTMIGQEAVNRLYVLGHFKVPAKPKKVAKSGNAASQNLVYILNLKTLVWEIQPQRLPAGECNITSFKLVETEYFFVMKGALYIYHCYTNIYEMVKALEFIITCYDGPSFFYKGMLYCSDESGPARRFGIGELM